jgi:phage baseplate assembly protein V
MPDFDSLSADMNRRIESIVRIGVVADVDPDRARCRVASGGLETEWLPWLERRAGTTRDWDPPSVGEQCLLLSPSGDPACGVVLTGIPSDAHRPPSKDKNRWTRVFPDEATESHDHAGHHYALDVPAGGSIAFRIGGTTLTLTSSAVEIVTGNFKVKSAEARFEAPVVKATGTIQDLCDSIGKTMSWMRDLYNRHVHPENDSGGPTGEPNEKM